MHVVSLIHAGVGIAATKFVYKMLPLDHGFPTHGPPVCIMQTAVTFVNCNYACTTNICNNLGSLTYNLSLLHQLYDRPTME